MLQVCVCSNVVVLFILQDDLLGDGVFPVDAFRLYLLEVLGDGGRLVRVLIVAIGRVSASLL